VSHSSQVGHNSSRITIHAHCAGLCKPGRITSCQCSFKTCGRAVKAQYASHRHITHSQSAAGPAEMFPCLAVIVLVPLYLSCSKAKAAATPGFTSARAEAQLSSCNQHAASHIYESNLNMVPCHSVSHTLLPGWLARSHEILQQERHCWALQFGDSAQCQWSQTNDNLNSIGSIGPDTASRNPAHQSVVSNTTPPSLAG
jgi:hypothetical protein